MTPQSRDIIQFQLPDQSSGMDGSEVPVTDAPARKQAEATHSEAPWSQEYTATASVAAEHLTDNMEQFIKVAWEYSNALEELRQDALGE